MFYLREHLRFRKEMTNLFVWNPDRGGLTNGHERIAEIRGELSSKPDERVSSLIHELAALETQLCLKDPRAREELARIHEELAKSLRQIPR